MEGNWVLRFSLGVSGVGCWAWVKGMDGEGVSVSGFGGRFRMRGWGSLVWGFQGV